MTDARTRVEALVGDALAKAFQEGTRGRYYDVDFSLQGQAILVRVFTDCLLAFGAAQRAEERDEFVDLLVKLRDENGDGWLDRVRINLLTRVIDEVHSRARREEPGGEK